MIFYLLAYVFVLFILNQQLNTTQGGVEGDGGHSKNNSNKKFD